jgi:hypothetical protein
MTGTAKGGPCCNAGRLFSVCLVLCGPGSPCLWPAHWGIELVLDLVLSVVLLSVAVCGLIRGSSALNHLMANIHCALRTST